ncbi:glycosyltransferase family 4 protein [Pedobacter sp. UBA4863]|uniref:glycosyltransferase family 4 protein n=1 Tax=Pedobacter sp. UBA4863 TaxID=1947060 RepID=UPI0025CBEEAD|nr:glycosyltransferase family 4 protein [Pedobacter sp. UBA4863]
MKISVSCGGRFHGFDMAAYFEQQGYLAQLVTGYPKSEAAKFGISKKNVLSIYLNEVINRITNKLGLGYPLNTFACQIYDYFTALFINKTSDVYFLWSGYSLYTISAIRKKNPNAKIILVRGSAHILTQKKLLHKISPTPKKTIDNLMIKRELAEYELADYINVPSSFVLNTFIDHGFNKDKIFVNFLGVDLVSFPFTKKKTNKNSIVFGSVGTLCARKNTKGIIEAFNAVLTKNTDIKLIIAGPIDHFTFNRESLNSPNISYIQKMPQRDLFKIYKEIDVFIMNSVEEGMAMVQLQAMASGCALISTPNSGGEDLIDPFENGLLIKPFDNKDLQKSLEWFIKNKQLITKMGAISKIKVENGFTWDDFGKRNIDFAKKIVNR